MSLVIIFLIGFGASFLASFTSGVLAITSLLLLQLYGITALPALAIFRVGAVGSQAGGLITYIRAKRIVWRRVIPMIVIGSIGSYLGGRLILSINETVITKVIGWSILVIIPFLLLRPNVGTESRPVSRRQNIIGYCIYFFSSFWGASFAVGTGVISMFNQTYSFGMTQLEVKGTNKIPALIKNIIVLSLFVMAGLVRWRLSLVYMAGMFVGGFVGAHYTVKLGDVWLRRIFLVTIAVLALKFILGL